MVRVDLLVIELVLVCGSIDGVIAVGEELGACRVFRGGGGGGARSVGEPHGFWRGGCAGVAAEGFLEKRAAALGVGGGVGEVGGEGGVVGLREAAGVGGGEAVELGG